MGTEHVWIFKHFKYKFRSFFNRQYRERSFFNTSRSNKCVNARPVSGFYVIWCSPLSPRSSD